MCSCPRSPQLSPCLCMRRLSTVSTEGQGDNTPQEMPSAMMEGIGDNSFFQHPHSVGGSTLRCVLQSPGVPGGTEPQFPTVVTALAAFPSLSQFPTQHPMLPGLYPQINTHAHCLSRALLLEEAQRRGREHGRFEDRKRRRVSSRQRGWSEGQEQLRKGLEAGVRACQ